MGRRSSKSMAAEGWLRRALMAVDPRIATAVRGLAWRGSILLTLVLLVAGGLRTAERRVRTDARFDVVPELRWVQTPDWLNDPANAHVLAELNESCGLSVSDRLMDAGLARRVAERLSRPENAWVSSVRQVRVGPDGCVEVQCDFREPAAWVRQGRTLYLLASDGVRLPGAYRVGSVSGTALPTVEGVAGGVPETGELWAAEDLQAGLSLLRLCAQRPFAKQLAGVDVWNFRGRHHRLRPHLELLTDRAGSRVWWGRAPGEEDGCEIAAGRKLALLESLYRRWGRVDLNLPYVSVTTWHDRVGLPADALR